MEALELIKKDNPLPAICGSICNHRCEQVCTRGDIDDPVAIDEVKKFIARKEMDVEKRFVPEIQHDEGHKVAVIGSGPAGLSCAYYLATLGHKVTVFEKENKLGGMLRFGLPSFRLEKDIIDAEIEVLRSLGVEFKTHVEIGKDTTIDLLRSQGYKGFYIAIGAQSGRKLGIDGEDAEGVISGIDFLRDCAVNNKVKVNGNILVIGGGNVAIDVARTAVRGNTNKTQMFCLEPRGIMPASDEEIEEAENEGIKISNGWGPKEILTKGGKAIGVIFKKCISVFDEDGRFNPKYDEDNTITVEADYVLATIGQSIQWGNLIDGTAIELNGNKTAKANKLTYQTKEPDIFIGGDVYTGPKFAIDAIAAGKQGAESLHRYVWGHNISKARDRRDYQYIDKDNLDIEGYDTSKRQKPASDKLKKMSFRDDRLLLTEDQVKAETSRCLSCGVSHIDQNICLGCGVCTKRCKFDAIQLIRKFDTTPKTLEEMPATIAAEMQRRKDLFAGQGEEV